MAATQTLCLESPTKVEATAINSRNPDGILKETQSTRPTRTLQHASHSFSRLSRGGSTKPSLVLRLYYAFTLLWGFTESDFITFVIPNMTFGLLGAFASTALIQGSSNTPSASSLKFVVRQMPALLAYNWANLLIFDLANQRGAASAAEDKLNKPWRPIPSGRITREQTRRTLLAAAPVALALDWYLGVWTQGVLIHVVTWLYNDLQGGDEFLVREGLIAVGYAMFNSGSLKVAGCGNTNGGIVRCDLNVRGWAWTAMVSAVIFTTMQVQDLKDVEGDRLRGRRTVVLHAGEAFSRWSIAACVVGWSVGCARFWVAGRVSSGMVLALGGLVSWRCVRKGGEEKRAEDRGTWKLWCLWLVFLYMLPVVGVFDRRD